MKFAKSLLLFTLSTALLAACSSDEVEPRRTAKALATTGTGTTANQSGVLIVELTAASATGTVNQTVSLTAQGWLDTAKSTPVTSGTTISFSRLNANGTLSAASAPANAQGQAVVTLTSSAPGSVTATATIDSVDSNSIVVAFSSAPGGGGGGGGSTTPAITISSVSSKAVLTVYDDNAGNAGDVATVTFTVLDGTTPVVGALVKLSASSGSLSSNLLLTNASGVAAVTYTAGLLAEDAVITAAVGDKTAKTMLIVTPGAPASIVVERPSPDILGLQGSGSPESSVVVFTVKDSYGNLVSDSNLVSLALTPVLGGSTVTPTSMKTNKGKISPVVHAGNVSGTMQLVATVGGISVTSGNITIMSNAVVLTVDAVELVLGKTSLTVYDGAPLNTGDQSSVVVTIRDQNGAVMAGVPVKLSSSTGSLSSNLLTTDISGTVTATYTSGSSAVDAVITAVAGGKTGTSNISILPGEAFSVAADAPSLNSLGFAGSGAPESSVVSFTVRDQYGNLVSDSTVVNLSLTPALAGATVSPASMTTNQGRVSPVVHSGVTAGIVRVNAVVVATGSPAGLSGEIRISGGDLTSIAVVSDKPNVNVYDDSPLTGDQATIVATLLNQYGAAMPGVSVNLSASTGSLSSNLLTSDALGKVTVTYTAGTAAGIATITASAGGKNAIATLSVLPAAPFFVEAAQPSLTVLGLRGSGSPENSVVTFTIRDEYGNLVSDSTLVTFSLNPTLTGASVSPVSMTTNKGVISPIVHSGSQTGSMRLIATVTAFGNPSATSADITVTAGEVNSVAVLALKSSVTVYDGVALNLGDQSSVTVTVRNQNGLVMPGVPVSLSASSGNLSSNLELTDSFGNVTVTYTAGTIAGDAVITATAGTVDGFTTLPVLPGAPTVISVGAASLIELGLQGSGAPETSVLTFTVRDQYGNLASNATVLDFTLVPALAGATVSPASMNTNAGVISPVVQAGTATGTMRVVATVSGSSVSVTSGGITVGGGVVSSVTVTSSTSQVTVYNGIPAGPDEATVYVMVRDQYGNALPNVSVALSYTGGSLSTALAMTDAFGVASVTFVAGIAAEDVVITAVADGIGNSAALQVLPGAPFSVEVAAPAPSLLGLDGSGLPRSSVVAVTVRDQYGNLVANDTEVLFSLSPALAGASVSPASLTTFNGKINPIVHAGTVAGNMQLVATVLGGSPSAMSSGITIFEEAYVVSSVSVTSSTNTVTVYDDAILNTGDQAIITVTVRDQSGAAVGSNVPVVLSTASGNLSAANLNTNGAGTVTATYTAGLVAGVVEITATAAGFVGTTSLTVTPGAGFVIELGTPTPSELGLQGSGAPEISVVDVTVKDKYGNLVSDNTVVSYILAPALSGASVSPATITTHQGLSKAFIHTGVVSGTMRLIASTAGRSVISSEIAVVGEPASQVGSILVSSSINSIQVNDGDPLNLNDEATISVSVKDRDGAPLSGIDVLVSTSAGSLTDSVLTTVNGTASVKYTAGIVAEVVTITAAVGSVQGTLTLVVGPGAPFIIEVGEPVPSQLGVKGSGSPESSVLLITIKDQAGNPVSDSTTVTFRMEPALGGASVSPITATTHTGIVSAVVISGTKSGAVRLVATVGTHSVTSGKITIFGGLPSADRFELVVEGGKRVMSGFVFSGLKAAMTVFMADTYGNPPQPGTGVYVACEAGRCGANAQPGIQTDENGVASFEFETAFSGLVYKDYPLWVSAPQNFYGNVGTSHTWPKLDHYKKGWVTILAMATGQSGYTDLNGNNVFDAGFDIVTEDPSEPYLDIDDTGTYSDGAVPVGSPREDFWDFDMDGTFDSHAVPSYHDQQYIWAENTVIFATAPNLQMVPQQFIDFDGFGDYDPYVDIAVVGGPAPINQAAFDAAFPAYAGATLFPGFGMVNTTSTTVAVSFSDDNNNPLPMGTTMAFAASTGLTVDLPPAGALAYGADYMFPLPPVNFPVKESQADLATSVKSSISLCAEITISDGSKYSRCIEGVRF